ncbi:hypothetical protein OFY17_08565 [Marinomonas sp. C2222]|uniref:ParE-like toxin domain-containing protein n=1 Tax=Marinomonas sargassi TaxID=2984494 RepID=A0ABT2YSQ9_9GAMM|nr:hypothetical protein [Marinomonas sargassi]MCV2402931.1 hypothetical protein [Marinomonas sargassi]
MMKLIIQGLESIPRHLRKKAKKEALQLSRSLERNKKWKKISSKKNMIRCKINRSYRLVVYCNDKATGPYFAMNHTEFDRRYS